jgi:hypothetical protein
MIILYMVKRKYTISLMITLVVGMTMVAPAIAQDDSGSSDAITIKDICGDGNNSVPIVGTLVESVLTLILYGSIVLGLIGAGIDYAKQASGDGSADPTDKIKKGAAAPLVIVLGAWGIDEFLLGDGSGSLSDCMPGLISGLLS